MHITLHVSCNGKVVNFSNMFSTYNDNCDKALNMISECVKGRIIFIVTKQEQAKTTLAIFNYTFLFLFLEGANCSDNVRLLDFRIIILVQKK